MGLFGNKKKPRKSAEEAVPEMRLMPPSSRTIRCPECDFKTQVAMGEKPVCPQCGFS